MSVGQGSPRSSARRRAARARSRRPGATVRELLEDLTTKLPALGSRVYGEGEIHPFVNVYVDGEDVRTRDGLDTPVRDGVDSDPPAGDGRRLCRLARCST